MYVYTVQTSVQSESQNIIFIITYAGLYTVHIKIVIYWSGA